MHSRNCRRSTPTPGLRASPGDPTVTAPGLAISPILSAYPKRALRYRRNSNVFWYSAAPVVTRKLASFSQLLIISATGPAESETH